MQPSIRRRERSPDRSLLLIAGSLALGGAERTTATLAGAWAARGHSVTLLSYAPAATDHFHLPTDVHRVSINLMWTSNGIGARILSAVRRHGMLRNQILAVKPEVVVAIGELTSVRTLISCLGLGIPILVCERTDPRQHVLPWPWRVLRRLLYPLAACVVVQTESVAQWARGFVPAHRVRVIPNPVRPVPEPAARPEALGLRRTVIAVGRLGREKGFDVLLRAYARSALPSAMWQLVILGDGPERESLLRQVTELGLQSSVLMPGVVRDPEQWLQHAELFVLPSRFEGFPNALLEAMHCGLAVAAFDCPSGPGEILRHGQTGLLVPPGDVAALSATISRLAADPDLRQRLSSAATADVASRFSLEHITNLWEETWESALGRA